MQENTLLQAENLFFSYEPGKPNDSRPAVAQDKGKGKEKEKSKEKEQKNEKTKEKNPENEKEKERAYILKGLTFSLQKGERVGLVGANGAGKSTLLRLLVGLHLPYEGSLTIKGLPLEKKNLPAIRKSIGYVFQDSDSQLFMNRVEEDVSFGPRNYGYCEEEVKQRTEKALEAVGITHLRDKSIYKLSGGEKKLASIAGILSLSPDLLLLDEPSAALDPRNRRQLIGILNVLPAAKLIASHDLDFILDTCERTILIGEGRILADGESKDILTREDLLLPNGLELPLSLTRK